MIGAETTLLKSSGVSRTGPGRGLPFPESWRRPVIGLEPCSGPRLGDRDQDSLRAGVPRSISTVFCGSANRSIGLRKALGGNFDVIVLDRMLPEIDGLSLLTELRAAKVSTP